MKLITTCALARYKKGELSVLFARVSCGVALTGEGTPERRAVLGSLANIIRARIARRP